MMKDELLNPYENHVYEDILSWEEQKEGGWVAVMNNAVASAFAYSSSFIPGHISEKVAVAIESALHACFSGSLYTTSKSQIVYQANKLLECEVECMSDLKSLELEQLDQLSSSYCTTSEVLALLEGAGMGLGGIVFVAADIPTLVFINIRMLVQLAFIYGIDPSIPSEREYILNVMTLSAADQNERVEILINLDHVAKNSAQTGFLQRQIQDNLVGEAMRKMIDVAHRIAVRLTHAKLLQFVPFVGAAMAAGVNFMYTKEMTQNALMVFRKRWLIEKYGADKIRTRCPVSDDKMLTSWILVGSGETEEDVFEEDFRSCNFLTCNDGEDKNEDEDLVECIKMR